MPVYDQFKMYNCTDEQRKINSKRSCILSKFVINLNLKPPTNKLQRFYPLQTIVFGGFTGIFLFTQFPIDYCAAAVVPWRFIIISFSRVQ